MAQIHSFIEKFDTDSLELLIPQRQGTDLADVYNQLATSFSYNDPPLCGKYASLSLDLSRELGYCKGIGDAERYTGLMKMYAGRYPETVVHFYNALENYELADDQYGLAKLYFDFAKLYFYTGNYQKTEEYGLKSIELHEKKKPDGTQIGTLQDIARLKSALGLLYRTTNRSEEAKEIYRWYNRIMVEERFEITDQLVHTQLLGRTYDETGFPDSALLYFQKTLDFPEVNNSIIALKMESKRSIGVVYYNLKNFREAEKCFKQVALVMEEKGFLRTALWSNLMLGKIYFEENELEQAEYYFNKAMSNNREMIRNHSYYRYDSLRFTVSFGGELYVPWPENLIKEDIWNDHARISAALSDLYQLKGEWRKSTVYLISLVRAKDSLHELQRNRDLLEMQTKYETSRKEQQLEKLAGENELKELRLYQSRILLFGLGVLIIFSIIIALLLIRQDKIRARQKTAILEQKLLRSQMNPHFIFNSLASIQDFILSKDARSAANYLSRFAGMIRNILDASLEESIPVVKEIETIEHYLELQKVRLEDKFDFIISKDEELDNEEIRIPALLVQPFVENALEHGIRHMQGKGMVRVSFHKEGQWLSVIVEDNGVGRENARKFEEITRKSHAGVSTTLILERLKILNKRSRRKISLEIRDLFDDTGNTAGTRVEIRVPVE